MDLTTPRTLTETEKQLVRFQLANYDVILPSGVYAAQFEEAQKQLLDAKREYKETVKYCE